MADTNIPAVQEKILLVEDTPPVLRALERQLELANHDFVSARNGAEALKILAREKDIGLIISDWMMPQMDGLALLLEMKQDARFRDIPFFMLTGEGSGRDAAQALQAGANAYMTKPYSPRELMAQVEKLFKRQRQRKDESR